MHAQLPGGEAQFADLVNAIRHNEPINEVERVAQATMTNIMGRMSAYTGRALSWKFALHGSQEDLRPEKYVMGDLPVRPVAGLRSGVVTTAPGRRPGAVLGPDPGA